MEKLDIYSPKMKAIFQEIEKDDKQLVIVYSQYRNVEGLEIMARVLEQNGYTKYKKTNTNKKYDFKRYGFYSGKEDIKERNEILESYTDSSNKYGKNIIVLFISSAGAEGINLKCVRKVLIMEPFWHDVRIKQVVGRAIRKKSHIELLEKERNVVVIRYFSVFSEEQKKHIREKLSTDEHVYDVAIKKLEMNGDFLSAIKDSSIDCMLNQCNSESCYLFDDKDGLAFLPYINQDIAYNFRKLKPKKDQIILCVE